MTAHGIAPCPGARVSHISGCVSHHPASGTQAEKGRGGLEVSLSPKDPALGLFFIAYGHLRDQATLISIGLMDSAQN